MLMTRELVTVSPGVSTDRSRELLHKHRIEKLLVVDANGKLAGLITIKDLMHAERNPNAVKDEFGRLRVEQRSARAPIGWSEARRCSRSMSTCLLWTRRTVIRRG